MERGHGTDMEIIMANVEIVYVPQQMSHYGTQMKAFRITHGTSIWKHMELVVSLYGTRLWGRLCLDRISYGAHVLIAIGHIFTIQSRVP